MTGLPIYVHRTSVQAPSLWYVGTLFLPGFDPLMTQLSLDCQPLSLEDVGAVARGEVQVCLGPRARRATQASRKIVEQAVAERRVVYGVTTGFGRFADRVIGEDALEELQQNLLMSHAVGVGAPLQTFVVRAMMLLRAVSLAHGRSGVRPEIVELLIDMLNAGVHPLVPSKGSVGASGDLAPLAHLGLVLIGLGEAEYRGELFDGAAALHRAGLSAISLRAKEGLALINGTQLMTSLAVQVIAGAENLLDVADIAGSLTLDAVRGTDRPFDARIHEARPHPGQIVCAERLRRLMQGSEILASHRTDGHKVQDPYSLRCMPQVHGASRDAVRHARTVTEIEINSVTDNPLIFDDGEIVSGGNFHGQPVAIALDLVAIALAEIANISERRTEAMLDTHFSELPPFLTLRGGVDSGFMVSQYTAASLVSENKVLAHPASVDSIPTSANQEDHVSMGVTAGLKALSILENAETVLAIELLCAAEGIDYRRPLRTSHALEAVHESVRRVSSHVDRDRPLYRDIAAVAALVSSGAISMAAGNALAGA